MIGSKKKCAIGFALALLLFTQACSLIGPRKPSPLDTLLGRIATNDPAALHDLAVLYDTGVSVSEVPEAAFTLFKLSAEQGYEMSYSKLGSMYFSGRGTARDYDESLVWLEKAATLGHIDSQVKTAHLYQYGLATAVNLVAALKWYELAANQGDSVAQFNAGSILASRGGEERSLSQDALDWYQLSANQGNRDAQLAMGDIYRLGKRGAVDNLSLIHI